MVWPDAIQGGQKQARDREQEPGNQGREEQQLDGEPDVQGLVLETGKQQPVLRADRVKALDLPGTMQVRGYLEQLGRWAS